MVARTPRMVLTAALMVGCMSQAPGQKNSSPPYPSPARSAARYGDLPLSFESNQGQAASGVRFVARGSGYSLSLTDSAAVLSLAKHVPKERIWSGPGNASGNVPRRSAVVRMKLSGASVHPRVEGEDRLEGIANYFIGNDPARWVQGIPTYGRVRYAGVYPGVELVYYGNQRQLEYDFVVAPGADGKQIRLQFSGASGLRVTAGGDLDVSARDHKIFFHKPDVYQWANGKKEAVQGRFALLAGNTVGFTLGAYDHGKPLVIDPVLVYATYLGGTNGGDYGGDSAAGIAVDAAGNAYITGQADSTDFPVTKGAFQTTNVTGYTLAFVTKLNPAGTGLIYSTYLGGTGDGGVSAAGIAVDSAGSAYITGKVSSNNFPVTTGAFQTVNRAGVYGNAFVTKLNSTGTGLIYSTLLGGTSGDAATAIAVDSAGNAYVTGNTAGTDFPVTNAAYQLANNTLNHGITAFITKFNPEGSELVYSTYLGGNTKDYGTSIAISSSGAAYVTGYTYSTGFPVSSGAFESQMKANPSTGGRDAFVTALSASGSSLIYSSFLGGSYSDRGFGIAVDSKGDAYVTGNAYSSDFPVTPGAFLTTNTAGEGRGFIAKVNPGGTALVYSTYLGGPVPYAGSDQCSAIAVDAFGDAFVTGTEESTDFPVTTDALQGTDPGGLNAFVTELNPAGSALLYSTYFGGSQIDYGDAIALDSEGDVFIAGQTFSTNLPVTTGAFQTTNAGAKNDDANAFVAKLEIGPAPAQLTAPTPGSTLKGTSAEFTWTAGIGVTAYDLRVGTTAANSPDLFSSGTTKETSATVDDIPTSGGTVFVALYSEIDGAWVANFYTFTESGTTVSATLTEPTKGTVLSGTAATAFTWTTGKGVTAYKLLVGTTGAGSSNILNTGTTEKTSASAGPFTADGGMVFVTLESLIDGVWKSNAYTFLKPGTPVAATLLAPVNGSTLSGTAATKFTWTTGTGVTAYQLLVGTTGGGSSNILSTGSTEETSASAGPLPANGGMVYVTLYSLIDGAWKSNAYTFVESGTPVAATLTAPVNGSTLSGTAAATFTWTTGKGVTAYQLRVGTTGAGSSNILSTGSTEETSASAGLLPANGGMVYATLYSLIDGAWKSNAYTFVETGTPIAPVLLTPVPGTMLEGANVTFTWSTGKGVTAYELRLGTTETNSSNLYNSDITQATSASVSGLPLTDVTIYATLYAEIDGVWTTSIYTYTASNAAVLPQDETILWNFAGNTGTVNTDGWSPSGGLVMDSQGNLYGTTQNSGLGADYAGTVFKVTPSGTEIVLHTFDNNGTDGFYPNGGMVIDSQGNLYGTTWGGGNGNGTSGVGTVFKVASDGTETILHNFSSTGADGWEPAQGLVMDNKGNLYGTTSNGGNSSGCGTVFKVTPSGTETVLYRFSGPDGCRPAAGDNSGVSGGGPGLAMDAQGNLYGTTYEGGEYSYGTVFKLAPNGTETVLHSFANIQSDGHYPHGGLALDSQGNLYGTTASGGLFIYGTIFKVTPSGDESVLYNFSVNFFIVQPGLILDGHQNLYGASSGDVSNGTVFQLSPSGVLTVLHSFSGSPDGSFPQGGLLLAANGSLYGTTSAAGSHGNSGTVFKLSPSVTAPATPVFSLLPGIYSSQQTLTITDATPGATIYYALNGNIASSFYQGPLTISSSSVVSAAAVLPGGATSASIQAMYMIDTAEAPAALVNPAPGSTLPGTSATFLWSTGSQVTAYQLLVGTTGAGSQNIYNSGTIDAGSVTVSGLPSNGKTIYVTLKSLMAGSWWTSGYTFTAYTAPASAAAASPVSVSK